jgi:hypothetical protein
MTRAHHLFIITILAKGLLGITQLLTSLALYLGGLEKLSSMRNGWRNVNFQKTQMISQQRKSCRLQTSSRHQTHRFTQSILGYMVCCTLPSSGLFFWCKMGQSCCDYGAWPVCRLPTRGVVLHRWENALGFDRH